MTIYSIYVVCYQFPQYVFNTALKYIFCSVLTTVYKWLMVYFIQATEHVTTTTSIIAGSIWYGCRNNQTRNREGNSTRETEGSMSLYNEVHMYVITVYIGCY